jgi:hypothetical protein
MPDSNGMSGIVQSFTDAKTPPDIAFLGSSVAKHIINLLPEDEVRSRHIANLTFNLQMVSDQFILSKKLLKPPVQPKLVVLCVSPRDFIDNDARDTTRTTTFRRLVMLDDLPTIGSVLHLSFFENVKAAYSLLCCFYDQRSAIQKHLSFETNEFYDRLSSNHATIAAHPNEETWSHSMKEYAWRYEGIDVVNLDPQLFVLKQTVELCRKRGMKVVLVNVPMSSDNLTLLPPGFYEQYRNLLKDTARNAGCRFLDCAQYSDKITRADFADCAHLNKVGALKVFALLKPIFDEQIAVAR